MSLVQRAWRAYRRVGVRGLLSDLRWRYRVLLGDQSFGAGVRAAVRIVRDGGPSALVDRIRYGLKIGGEDTSARALAADHPWLQTFAHMAAFEPFFDLSQSDLDANRRVVAAFDERPGEIRTATWFLPYFKHVLFGGVHTILRLMAYLRDEHGVEHRLVVFDNHDIEDEEIRRPVAAAFPTLTGIDIVLPFDGMVRLDELPATDIAVCTMWVSAFPLARFNATRAKFYMVQDFEPSFYPAGTISALAEATYRFGFAGIVNTPGLAEVYRSYGNRTVQFVPAFADARGSTAKPSQRGGPIRIVLYGRPSTDRNAFELIAAASVKVKRKFGDRVQIVAAGEEWAPDDFQLEGVIENLGLLQTIDEVQQLYRDADIGIAFMLSKHPSYQPFEYLAAGVAPICNVNPATSWFLRHEENCLITEPLPSAIAAAVARLVEDPGLRAAIVAKGNSQVLSTSWSTEFDRIWQFMSGADRSS